MGAQGDEKAFQTLKVPVPYRTGFPEEVIPGNIARNYAKMAKDLQEGTHTAPSFDDAVALHRVIAAVEQAAETGHRTKLI